MVYGQTLTKVLHSDRGPGVIVDTVVQSGTSVQKAEPIALVPFSNLDLCQNPKNKCVIDLPIHIA